MSKQDEFFDRADVHSSNKNSRVKSDEEVRKERQERLEKLVTPELLTHFSPQEAFRLVEYFNTTPSSGTQERVGTPYDLYKLSPEARAYLEKHVKDQRIIEIGDAGRKINMPFFMKLGARSFETADPNFSEVDGLTYLMRQPEGSALVCSFGVFDDGVLYMDGCEIGKSLKEYVGKLCKEIYRVTPKGGITLHGLEWDGDLKDAGFTSDSNTPNELNAYTPQRHGLRVLRR